MKPILLIPMAGLGQRFRDVGYVVPKPFIVVDQKQIIDYAFDSINVEDYSRIIFIVRQEHINSFEIDSILRQKFGSAIEVIAAQTSTQGSVCSCLLAKDTILGNGYDDVPLVIYTLDVSFRPKFLFKSNFLKYSGGFILTFQSNSPNYSYAQNENGLVKRTAEKDVISGDAIVGIYSFTKAQDFFNYAEKMIAQNLKTNNEFYLAPLYNLLIKDGLTVGFQQVDKMHVIGTPEELSFFKKNVLPKFGVRPIVLCGDHSGFEIKEKFKKIARNIELPVIDFGTYTLKDCDYVDYVRQGCQHIIDGYADFGIGFCRSGQGVNIAANKIKGIRSALVIDEYMAEFAVRHNCANFFSLPSKYVDEYKLMEILNTIQINSFDGGRHAARVRKLE